jgi:NitT/TauT family transport system substrate-binding protein
MRRLLLFICAVLVLSACGAPAASSPTSSAPAASSTAASAATDTTPASANATPVSIGMGYIPDVQFAPFYVAQSKGYYAEEGLDVTFSHGSIQDKLIQTAQGQLTFVNASGDEVLLARGQDIPIKLVFQTYQESPVAIFAKQQTGIAKPEDLNGKTIGVPGRFGATYIGLLGVLANAGLDQQAVNIAEIGFTQAQAVRSDSVQAAVGFANNEPFLLQSEGVPVNVLRVSDYFSLVSTGIVASERLIQENPDLVRRFVRATARGLQDTLDNPDEAFQIALTFIPELDVERQPRELQKLKETLAFWRPQSDANELGVSNPEQWQTTYRFLRESGILQRELDVQAAFTNDLQE